MHEEAVSDDEERAMMASPMPSIGGLGFITGVINTDKLGSFERIIFRTTRGNMLMKHASVAEPIIDPVSVRNQ